MQEYMKDLGLKVEDEIIPRPINPILFNYKSNYDTYDYDFITIGNYESPDRKNLRMIRDLAFKTDYKFCLVSNVFIPPSLKNKNVVQYDFGSIDDKTKAVLLSKSKFFLWLSFVEGFGMPPLEAMAVGCVPIYTDVPAHNEFCVGIPIKPIDKIKTCGYGVKIIKYIIDEKDVLDTINYALGLKREEYENLSQMCKEVAYKKYVEFINKVCMLWRF
jgi:glycosyltransferase involved in cell wall biosynthesis